MTRADQSQNTTRPFVQFARSARTDKNCCAFNGSVTCAAIRPSCVCGQLTTWVSSCGEVSSGIVAIANSPVAAPRVGRSIAALGSDTKAEKPRTRPSMTSVASPSCTLNTAGISVEVNLALYVTSSRPARPPSVASTQRSTASCPTCRVRDAPRNARMATPGAARPNGRSAP